MSWIILAISGGLEVVWATALKASEGFSKPLYSGIVAVAAFLSFWLLAYAMRSLPLGTAYPVWVGIGAIGSFIMGIYAFGETASPLRLASAGLIVIGIAGLKLAEG
ncbi:MAG: multidrug efflux SMR transporter [Planktotalea sp.]|uniref:DMT family transporter n=1 Tax=Planktotalea sp. TaxID=2029877 RepID=UPI003C7742A6